jgi:hypothetical protein
MQGRWRAPSAFSLSVVIVSPRRWWKPTTRLSSGHTHDRPGSTRSGPSPPRSSRCREYLIGLWRVQALQSTAEFSQYKLAGSECQHDARELELGLTLIVVPNLSWSPPFQSQCHCGGR